MTFLRLWVIIWQLCAQLGKYLAGRLLQLIPLLWAVMTLVFVLVRMVPGDPSLIMLGVEATVSVEATPRIVIEEAAVA